MCASIQTLAASGGRRLRRLQAHGTFRLVVVDEAHHAAAATYRAALSQLGFLPPVTGPSVEDVEGMLPGDDIAKIEADLAAWDREAPRDRLLVGVTATPNRSDAVGLGCVFQTIAYSYGLRQAIDDGWLVPITAWAIDTQDCLDEVKTNRGEFNQRELADAVNNARRNQLAVAAWHEHAHGLPTIAFTVDVAHAHALAETFNAAGLRAAAVSGETPKDDRRGLLAAFSRGDLDVLCNCMVLTEGTDLPNTRCILHAKPTKSATLYEQMTGRGLRVLPPDPAGPRRLKSPGPFLKPECVVIDLVDVSRKHSLQTAPVLYGLPPQIKAAGKTKLEELANEWDEWVEKHPNVDVEELLAGKSLTLAEFAAAASRVDLWRIPDLGSFAKGRELEWMRQSPTADIYRLEYPWQDGKECITIRPDLVGWEIVVSYRLTGQQHATSRTIATGVPSSDAAAALAEAFVAQDRTTVMRMKGVNAAWKKNPVTPKQAACLRKWRIPFDPEKTTAGHASQLMDLWMMRHGRTR